MAPVKYRHALDLEQRWTSVRRELMNLMNCGPGEQPNLLIEARRLLNAWRDHEDSAIRRRATDVVWAFEDWFGPRRWHHMSDKGERARQVTVRLIQRLEEELDAYYRPVVRRDTSEKNP
jgi:hypothetical protein